MALKFGTNMISYGSRSGPEFIFTEDHMFGIEIIDTDYGSHYLYINIDANINSSPLKNFIDEGFIIQVPENDDFLNKHDDNTEIKKDNIEIENDDNMDIENDMTMPIILQYQPRRGVYEDIPGGYYKYRFHRPLMDYRYNEKGERLEENEDLLNENDCLNFGECSTGKYIGLEKQNVKMFPYQYGTSILQAKETGAPFGVSDEDNINLLKVIPLDKINDFAVPNAGECYAMVRTKFRPSFMYHIAFCIYTHDDVNITLEACADHGREYMPRFQFYDRNSNGMTFYKRYSKDYPLSKAIVLQGRDQESILHEINEEMTENIKNDMEIGGKKIKRKSTRKRIRKPVRKTKRNAIRKTKKRSKTIYKYTRKSH